MKLYSEQFCDHVSISDQYYLEFSSKISAATNFEEDRLNDVIYYAYDIFEEIEFDITKRRLLLKLADILDVLTIDDIISIKHYELIRLLRSSKDNYLMIYENISSGNSEQFDSYIAVDSDE